MCVMFALLESYMIFELFSLRLETTNSTLNLRCAISRLLDLLEAFTSHLEFYITTRHREYP